MKEFLVHIECGKQLSISAGEVLCYNCGHIPVTIFTNTLTDEPEEWLPILIKENIVAEVF